MTVGKKLQMTLAMLEQVKGSMQSFALDTSDPLAQKMYTDFHRQLDQISNDFRSRINYVEEQEPQYKMENMMQSKQDNMQQQ